MKQFLVGVKSLEKFFEAADLFDQLKNS